VPCFGSWWVGRSPPVHHWLAKEKLTRNVSQSVDKQFTRVECSNATRNVSKINQKNRRESPLTVLLMRIVPASHTMTASAHLHIVASNRNHKKVVKKNDVLWDMLDRSSNFVNQCIHTYSYTHACAPHTHAHTHATATTLPPPTSARHHPAQCVAPSPPKCPKGRQWRRKKLEHFWPSERFFMCADHKSPENVGLAC
jgi:hypothetical protein